MSKGTRRLHQNADLSALHYSNMQCFSTCLQVYKSHLVETRGTGGPAMDSARANLASTFVNAFVNAGFGQVHHTFGRAQCQPQMCVVFY